ncbi:MAG: Methyltransferase type 11 [Candidatus Curtissbacteria bacterium GW2011_GWA1_40_24]|uniref:Methyltransferase type 11 n=1 Tax=Candidatus Curtissbacteria bacterium GW2011_GWA1_40_24 TaxID=1618406 RepID=A0A0G0RXW7_9BACT|nr:MAG: Methyltransferase type 11 [Candidatus Curtissbacteria bacterium GW2011_GWA1_40_24]
MNKEKHIKPLTLGFLTPFYDSIIKIISFDKFYQKIANQIPSDKAAYILDVGTGTANLAIAIKRKSPKTKILGIDPDGKILEIAKGKIRKEKLDIKLLKAFAQKLPFKKQSFDYVVSSFAIHHIPSHLKNQAFYEMHRVLRSGGTILIIDIGKPKNLLAKIAGTVFSLVESVGPNLRGFIPQALKEVGFGDVEEIESKFGLISFYRARKV